jgi:hypothetical protein
MPRPLYIFCAASGSIDQYTNAVSLYGLIESITYTELKPPPDQPPGTIVVARPLSMRVVAAWLKEDGDSPEQTFEADLIAFAPRQDQPLITSQFPPFKFSAPVHRLIVPELSIPPDVDVATVRGLLRFVSRLRRAGETDWTWTQEYAMLFIPEKQKDEESPPPQATSTDQSADKPA